MLCNDKVIETLQRLVNERARLQSQLEQRTRKMEAIEGASRQRDAAAQKKLQGLESKVHILEKCVEVCKKKFEELELRKN